MKEIWKKKWFFPFAAGLFLCVIALGVQLTYGAYLRRSYVKAVIATNETEKLFGSNLLYGVKNQPADPEADSWLTAYPYTVADPGQQSLTVPIKIYNYLAEDRDRVNQLDVSYIISFKIAGNPTMEGDRLNGYSVNGYSLAEKETAYYLGDGGLTQTKGEALAQRLPGRLPNLNEYNITMPGSDLGKVSIVVKAERISNDDGNNFGTDLLYLAARVVPCLASTVETATVEGVFLHASGTSPKDYAAYNYQITLNGADTMVRLRWNPDLLEIDPFCKEKFAFIKGDGQTLDLSKGEALLSMETGHTTIQFYRCGNVEDTSWEDFQVSVSAQ